LITITAIRPSLAMIINSAVSKKIPQLCFNLSQSQTQVSTLLGDTKSARRLSEKKNNNGHARKPSSVKSFTFKEEDDEEDYV